MAHGRKVHDEVEARRCLLAAKRADRSAGEWARAHGIDGRSPHAWLVNLERGGAFAPRRLERSPTPGWSSATTSRLSRKPIPR